LADRRCADIVRVILAAFGARNLETVEHALRSKAVAHDQLLQSAASSASPDVVAEAAQERVLGSERSLSDAGFEALSHQIDPSAGSLDEDVAE